MTPNEQVTLVLISAATVINAVASLVVDYRVNRRLTALETRVNR